MPLTIEDAKRWAKENSVRLDAARLACESTEVKILNRIAPIKSKELWDSGSWLAEQLRSHGASDGQISSIQMAQGQRAFMGSAWQAAVDYANEFIATGDTREKGGVELAEKRHQEIMRELYDDA